MKIAALAAVGILAATAMSFAQDAPAPAPKMVAPDVVTLKIPAAELQLIAAGVMKLPYEQAAPIIADLQAQLNAQMVDVGDTAKPATKNAPAKKQIKR